MARFLDFPKLSNWMAHLSVGLGEKLQSQYLPLEDAERRKGYSICDDHGTDGEQEEL